ncbi:MAG: HAD-IIB family hydrolase [Elusimicrobia bacterium]|nr:HAD-IIB family hydrolase [Elusimicrobiota bacterium]
MLTLALACDYDGTLASEGRVEAETLLDVKRLRDSGRRFLLVTGRVLEDLFRIFPEAPQVCDRIVAENGALLHRPQSGESISLAGPPPERFLGELKRRGVSFDMGRAIVATRLPYEAAVRDAINASGLDLRLILNKGSVMVLPAGVDKGTGLAAALEELALTPAETVGVGDAENDCSFLERCGVSAAVANALPALRERARLKLSRAAGAGVRELIGRMLDNDLAGC